MAITCKNAKLVKWVREVQEMVTPDKVVWCDGSKAEYDAMIKIMVDAGAATPLKKRPNSYLFRSHPSDVARVEDRTYIASRSQDEAHRVTHLEDRRRNHRFALCRGEHAHHDARGRQGHRITRGDR